MSAYVYVMRSALTGRHSIGATAKLDERFARRVHSAQKLSITEAPWECVYIEICNGLDEARQRAESLTAMEEDEGKVKLLYTSRINSRPRD
jgi:predicted GIY-YIG superfamily endonuclease